MPQTVGQYLGQKGPVISQHLVSNAYRKNAAESTFERYLRTGKPDETFAEWRDRMAYDVPEVTGDVLLKDLTAVASRAR